MAKFQINFNLILNLLANNEPDFDNFVNKSMMNVSIESEKKNIIQHILTLEERHTKKKELLEFCRTPISILKEYAQLLDGLKLSSRKRVKKILKSIKSYKDQHKFID